MGQLKNILQISAEGLHFDRSETERASPPWVNNADSLPDVAALTMAMSRAPDWPSQEPSAQGC